MPQCPDRKAFKMPFRVRRTFQDAFSSTQNISLAANTQKLRIAAANELAMHYMITGSVYNSHDMY